MYKKLKCKLYRGKIVRRKYTESQLLNLGLSNNFVGLTLKARQAQHKTNGLHESKIILQHKVEHEHKEIATYGVGENICKLSKICKVFI